MKVNLFKTEPNTGILTKTDKTINIKCHKFYDENNNYQPLGYEKIKSLGKFVYFLKFNGVSETHGRHISLNFIQNQKFLWMQGENWFQKEDNVRYVINILFLIIGCYLAYKQI